MGRASRVIARPLNPGVRREANFPMSIEPLFRPYLTPTNLCVCRSLMRTAQRISLQTSVKTRCIF